MTFLSRDEFGPHARRRPASCNPTDMNPSLRTSTALEEVAALLPFDAKRGNSKGLSVDRWYPYYAGFSGDFARNVLEALPLEEGATILDPWNGSGTTTYVADFLGHNAVGFDINPVATLVANAKLARAKDAEHILGLARRIAKVAMATSDEPIKNDPLLSWLRPGVTRLYRSIESRILADLASTSRGTTLSPEADALPPLASFVLLALVRAAKSVAGIKATTNPTWISPDDPSGTRSTLVANWLALLLEMSGDLATHPAALPSSPLVRIGDSRRLPLPDSSVDLVLTSPPYCTRLDYAISTAFELSALRVGRNTEAFASFRRSFMGTPLARPEAVGAIPAHWPPLLTNLLERIRRHPSKASHSYYYKTYRQYFADTDASLREMHRCLRPRAAAILVLQTSYYKNLRVDLPRLWGTLGESLGFTAKIVSTVSVRRALAQINSRSTSHRRLTSYTESLLTLEKQ